MSDLGNVQVVNVTVTPDFGTRPGDVYIGRKRRQYKTPSRAGEKMNRAGAFVSPYDYGDDVFTREEAIEKYELNHLFGTTNASQFIPQLSRLARDIRIGCVCKPKKCSGDILKYYLLEYRQNNPNWEVEVETGRAYDPGEATAYSEYLLRNQETFYGVRGSDGKYRLIPKQMATKMKKPYLIYIREQITDPLPKKLLHRFYDSEHILMSQYYEKSAKLKLPENETFKKYIDLAIERHGGVTRARKQPNQKIPVNRIVASTMIETLLKTIGNMKKKKK